MYIKRTKIFVDKQKCQIPRTEIRFLIASKISFFTTQPSFTRFNPIHIFSSAFWHFLARGDNFKDCLRNEDTLEMRSCCDADGFARTRLRQDYRTIIRRKFFFDLMRFWCDVKNFEISTFWDLKFYCSITIYGRSKLLRRPWIDLIC